jgi:hypothetical protein
VAASFTHWIFQGRCPGDPYALSLHYCRKAELLHCCWRGALCCTLLLLLWCKRCVGVMVGGTVPSGLQSDKEVHHFSL